MSGPFYACDNGDCAEECCYPADMLRVYEGKVWCEGCWDNAPTIWPDGQGGDTGCDWLQHWDLEPFIPEHEKRIAALEKVQEQYQELLYQVSIKHPDETRHETALRYIRQAEKPSNTTEQGQ